MQRVPGRSHLVPTKRIPKISPSYCSCGCGQIIPFKRWHIFRYKPKYLSGHNPSFTIHHSEEAKKKIGSGNSKPKPVGFGEKISKALLGHKPNILTEETRNKFRLQAIEQWKEGGVFKNRVCNPSTGNRNGMWKGGISKLTIRGKLGKELLNWKKEVWRNNPHECIVCKSLANLCAHHIFDFHKYPEYRLDGSKGALVCRSDHQKYHSRFEANEESFKRFLNA